MYITAQAQVQACNLNIKQMYIICEALRMSVKSLAPYQYKSS